MSAETNLFNWIVQIVSRVFTGEKEIKKKFPHHGHPPFMNCHFIPETNNKNQAGPEKPTSVNEPVPRALRTWSGTVHQFTNSSPILDLTDG